MSKNMIIGILVLAIVGLGAYILWPSLVTAPVTTSQTATTTNDQSGVVCAQVVTSARDPKSGTIKQFPTPCDVPDGWVVIQNDIPGFDLQPQ
jgi:hypothetical protein